MIPQQVQMINDLQNFRSHLRISKANRTFENNNDDSIERLQKEYKEFIQNDRRNHQSSYNIPNDQPLDRLESFIDRKLDSRSRNYSNNNNNSRIQLKNLMKSEPMQDFNRASHESTTPQKSINSHILQNNVTPYGFNPELNSYRAPSRSSSYNQEAYSISHSLGYNQQAQENYSPSKNYSHLAYATKLQQLEKQIFAQPYQYQNIQQPINENEQQQLVQPEYKQNTVPIIIEKPVFIEKKIYIEKPIYVEKEIEIPVYKPVYKEVKQEFPYSNPQSDRSNLNLLEQTHSVLSSSSKIMSKSPLKRQQTNDIAYASPPLINKPQEVPIPQKNIPSISPGVLKKAKFEGLSFIFDAIKQSLEKILNFNRDLSVALLENKPSQSSDNLNYLGIINSVKALCLDLMGDLVQNLKQQNFTQNVKYFIQIYTKEEIVPCQGFHLLFELKRFQFNRSNNVVGKSYHRDNLIISTFFIIRIVINQLLLRYKRYNLQHQEYDFTFNNAKIIGSVIYHLIRHNLQYNNPKHNIYSYKVEPLNGNFLLAEDELEQIAEKVPSLYGEDQMIYGMFAQSEIQDIINDDKFLRKFYKFQEKFVQMINQFAKEQ